MQFPVSYSSFTIPTGAGPTTSRIVLYPNGLLVSYDFNDSPPRYVAMFNGEFLAGPINAQNLPDGPQSAMIGWTFNSITHRSSLVLQSPADGTHTHIAVLQLVSSNPGLHSTVTINDADGGETDLQITGDIFANNLQAGEAAITTVANQWVQTTVTFATTFTVTPVVTITGNNGAPAVGGSTILQYAVTGISTTGFTLGVLRGSAVTMNIGWIATSPTQ
jgi:hypothetical protein